MKRTVSVREVKKQGACPSEVRRARALFGNRDMEFTHDLALVVIRVLDQESWFLYHLLTRQQRELFFRRVGHTPAHNTGDATRGAYWQESRRRAEALVEAYNSPKGRRR